MALAAKHVMRRVETLLVRFGARNAMELVAVRPLGAAALRKEETHASVRVEHISASATRIGARATSVCAGANALLAAKKDDFEE